MNEIDINNTLCIHLKGVFRLIGHPESDFIGPIKKGLRLVLWGDSFKKATSCSFVHDTNIKIGEKSILEIVILSPLSIDKRIQKGELYSIGIPGKKLGEFSITEIIGEWIGKVP